MRSALPVLVVVQFVLSSCGPPSAIVRPTVAAEPVGVVNDNDLPYLGNAATGMEAGRETAIAPHSCEVLVPPHGAGELRIRVTDPGQNTVLNLYGEALRRASTSCSCAGRRVGRCVHVPPAPPPDTAAH
ncbi:MAG: hypothetical protein WCJ30_21175 [Deltaproteobacteria bacterium]